MKQSQFKGYPQSPTQIPPPNRTTCPSPVYPFLTLPRKSICKSRDTIRRVAKAVEESRPLLWQASRSSHRCGEVGHTG